MTELKSLSRKLADSLFSLRCIHQDSHGKVTMVACRRCVDAVIREAVRNTLDAAKQAVLNERVDEEDTGDAEDVAYNCALGHAASAIESLKPSMNRFTDTVRT